MTITSLPAINKQTLFDHLHSGAVMLTVNNRLARRFADDYNQWQANSGKTVWESPAIQPLSAWLQQQVENLSDKGSHQLQILNADQERQLWTEIIQTDAYELYMMPAASIAQQVIQAWQLMQQWQIPRKALSAFQTAECQALLKWSDKFEKRCKQNNWLSQTLLINPVSEALNRQQCDVPQTIIFAGFEDPNKLHEQLLKGLVQNDCQLSRFEHQPVNQSVTCSSYPDIETELLAAANWTKERLLQTSEKDTRQNICVVVPSLRENRVLAYDTFNRVLHPERNAPPPYTHQSLFNLSLGLPLAQYPLVQDALAVFNLLLAQFTITDLGKVLNATYLSANSESAKTDVMLRETGRRQWSFNALLDFLNRFRAANAQTSNSCLDKLQKLQEIQDSCQKKQSPENWSSLFLSCWKAMGWPGKRTLDSDEYQQSERLLRLLSEFRQLYKVKPSLSLNEAIKTFRQMAGEVIFQVQSEDAPVQISGILEAADQQFTHLWFSGLDDQTLPARTAANPFIPLQLQTQYQVPHSSAEREQVFARNILTQLVNNASEVVISYPQREQDRELNPSPLIRTLDEYAMNVSQCAADTRASISAQPDLSLQMESYSDQQLPQLPMNKTARGGASILTQQAQCPFRANASFRLRATDLPSEIDGASPIDRGNQLHEIMEKLWLQIRTSQQLSSLDDDELQRYIQHATDEALKKYCFHRPDLYRNNFLELEKQRYYKLVNNWLTLEKQRQADFTVVQLEKDSNIPIGGLVLKTKADRIDQLASGEYLILDYKTGQSASSKSWLEEDITEPQLPLYSLAVEQDIAGLALAKINEKRCQFNGVTQSDGLLPGIKAFALPEAMHKEDSEDWQVLKQHWQQQLSMLASSYQQGQAHIKPDDCRYCAYPALCRRHELQVIDDEYSQ